MSDGSNPTTPTRPDAFTDASFDKYWDAKDGLKHGDLAGELKRLTAAEAADQTRKLTLPQSPDKYELVLPQDLDLGKDKDGNPVTFDFDANDPRLGPVRSLMHDMDQGKVSGQAAFSRLLGIVAQYELGESQRFNDAKKVEIDKLGANGPARVDAIGTWLRAQLGDASGNAILNRLVLASDVEGMENLIKKFSGQNIVPFNQQHRTGAEPPTTTREQRMYPSMANRG